jgi:ATP-dependent Lon protease
MSADFRGDPAAALLEVLDPEQNCAFMDHYLDLDYDLSKVFFITTANALHTIPPALKDRMEIIELSSYLETEKMRIGEQFLIPKQLTVHGLKPENLKISENALLDTIRYYTREAGVRNLEREIAALCRKVAVALVEEDDVNQCVRVNRGKLGQLLGVKKYRYDEREKEPQIGVCAGLAYTQTGGDILMVETALMPGKGKVVTTGQLGDVMKESAQAALSYVRSRADSFGLRPEFHQEVDVHVHIPAGATPKDGPSAGITLTTSIVSALLGIPVRHDIAMTGEITLRGRVLPVGGLREKLLSARRGMIDSVIMPKDNEKDLKEVPEEILKDLNLIFVEHVDEVLPLALATAGDELFSRRADREPLTKSLRRSDEVGPAAEAPAQ